MLARMFRPRTIAILLLALIIAAVSAAFASSITMPTAVTAAEGSRDMDSYQVTAVEYDIDASNNPATISEVTLTFGGATVPPDDSDVTVQLVASGAIYEGTVSSSSAACTTSGSETRVGAATYLRVIAGDATLIVTTP